MGILQEKIKSYLTDDQWVHDADDSTGIVRCTVKCRNASYRIIIHSDEKLERQRFLVYCPNFVPEHLRSHLCEFINRANYGLKLGNFEMDMKDGELRFRVSIDVEGGELTDVMIRNMLSCGYATMDRYYPGIMAVLYGGRTVEEAIAQVENPGAAAAPEELPEESSGGEDSAGSKALTFTIDDFPGGKPH